MFELLTLWGTEGAYLLHINLNVLLQIVAVQIEDQVMDKIKAVAHDDKRQLISQFRLLYMITMKDQDF